MEANKNNVKIQLVDSVYVDARRPVNKTYSTMITLKRQFVYAHINRVDTTTSVNRPFLVYFSIFLYVCISNIIRTMLLMEYADN